MSYLLNYKNWRAIHEAAIFEGKGVYGSSAILSPLAENDKALLQKFLVQGAQYKTNIVDAFNNLKILFTVTPEVAADYVLVGMLRIEFGKKRLYDKYANKDKKWEKDAEEILNSLHQKIEDNFSEEGIAGWNSEEFKLSQGKDPKTGELAEGMVLTRGKITSYEINGSGTSISATTDITKYLNTYNLGHHSAIFPSAGSEYDSMTIDENGAVDLRDHWGSQVTGQSFEENDIFFFALADYTPPSSKTEATYKPPFEVTTPGAQTVAEVKDAFEVLDVVPKQDKVNEVLTFIEKLKEAGTISKLEVVGGASTEAVSGATAAAWATKYGVAANTLPADAVINGTGTVGKVADPKASGNAWLASERGKRFAAALQRFPQMEGIAPTISAEIGADAGNSRFVKIVFEVKAKDTGIVVPGEWVVNTVATLGASTDLGGGYTIKSYYPNLF
jgi:hypothetical protein